MPWTNNHAHTRTPLPPPHARRHTPSPPCRSGPPSWPQACSSQPAQPRPRPPAHADVVSATTGDGASATLPPPPPAPCAGCGAYWRQYRVWGTAHHTGVCPNVGMRGEVTRTATSASIWCSTMAKLQNSTSGLGLVNVSGRRRVPNPPTRISAFIGMVANVQRLLVLCGVAERGRGGVCVMVERRGEQQRRARV